ncbi:MAG: PDZ domain-containing protein [Thermoanaerobaculia bacterium]
MRAIQRRGTTLLLFALSGFAGGPGSAAQLPLGSTAGAVERAASLVYPALVNISAVSQNFLEGRAMRYPSAGSGVIVSPAGDVLTNFHVAGHSTRLRCTLTDGSVYEADVVAHDPLTDLSVLRLRTAPSASPRSFPFARLATGAVVAVGDPVIALGNPYALSSSVTLGIVSNPHRVFTDFSGSELSDVELDGGETTGWLTRWIQHDALILPGNSGGPLVNLGGEVIGINELGGGGIGFAIPADVAADVLRRALDEGRFDRSFLGFSALPVSKLGRERGALVASVLPESPAAAAGLEPGDLLLELAGEPVVARFFEQIPELYQRIAALPVGSAVAMTVERDGRRLGLEARTTVMEPSRGEQVELRPIGITVEALTGPSALARNLPVRSGLLVTGVRPGQPAAAAKPPLQQGDLLLEVAGRKVTTLDELEKAFAEAGAGPRLIELRRSEQTLLSVVKLPEKRPGRWGGELPKAWLGVQTQVLTPELAGALGADGARGFRITEVYPWTEAEKAGFRVGDVLVAVGDEPLDASRVQDGDDLRRAVENHAIRERVEITLLRDGRELRLPVTLEPKPEASEDTRRSRQDDFEFSVRELTFLDRVERHWPRDASGVLVTEVTSGGWAHMAGLRLDDLIVSLDGRPVSGVADFEKVVDRIVAGRPALVQVFVRRGARTHFVFLEPEWAEKKGSS